MKSHTFTSTGELNLGKLLERHPELQIDRDNYNINVTANYGAKLSSEELFQRYVEHDGYGKPAHLYFHVPLCSYICHFCNYVKKLLPNKEGNDEILNEWTHLLIEESNRYLARVPWLPKARIESFYIGGGTGSLLKAEQLSKIMDHVRENYYLTPDCEISLEGNPDNYQNDELEQAISLGFNRFSVGVQSLQDEVNQFVGRKHDSKMSLDAINKLLATEKPFNVDIMFGLPFQTPQSVANDIRVLCELGVPTITIYRLRNADRQSMGIGNRSLWNVPKHRERLEREGLFPTLDETYQMREAVLQVFLEFGYHPSPCGWWSKPGVYPEGNIPRVSRNKWQRYDSMIAFGPGAYGWLTGGKNEILQTHNISDINAYVEHMKESKQVPLSFGRNLTEHEAVSTTLGFNFKSNQPIVFKRYLEQFGVDLLSDAPYKDVFEDLRSKGLIEQTSDAFIPTLDGESLHEEIISVYLHQRIGSFSEPICRRV
ncbi:coproporphyrinogen-III oxidase family protein [Mechercharimyces sp. CAU 1602]|uniref:coproporphyrinogen-III oxidase family protein n=1 Tax=Mechercharimyces sp. CAU 1602 TaxID=2973933 RepID=UPI0021639079|nr:radical SAM protein [Mechercharimyces sp. CAU 1602]MCS1352621.1 radical SAM protein [Mechercharimyces sp. CAU 1602]